MEKKMKLKMKTKLLLVNLLLLVTEYLTVDAANIPVPEGKSVEDIFNTLSTFRSKILNLISNGFTAPKKVNHNHLQESHHPVLLPSPPPQPPIHHGISQSFYVTSPPDLGHDPHPYFDIHGLFPKTHPFRVNDINIPSEIQFEEKPAAEAITSNLHAKFPKAVSDNLAGTDIDIFNKEAEESLHTGPLSFVDSERVNAGVEVASVVDEDTIKNIPVDLWREDIDGIKSNCKKESKNKNSK